MPKKNEGNFFDSLLAEMVTSVRSTEKMNIVDFAHEVLFNGGDMKLYPTQCAILKAFYKEPLDEEESKILETWLEEDRTTWVKDRRYISLILEAGRRGSKCNAASSRITTTEGRITFQELHNRLARGEKIGIRTYDLKHPDRRSYITYDIKSEYNAIEPVYRVTTTALKTETTNDHHPYLVRRSVRDKPQWVKLKDLKVGDKIACSKANTPMGTEYLSEEKAKLWADMIMTPKVREEFNKDAEFLMRLDYESGRRFVIAILRRANWSPGELQGARAVIMLPMHRQHRAVLYWLNAFDITPSKFVKQGYLVRSKHIKNMAKITQLTHKERTIREIHSQSRVFSTNIGNTIWVRETNCLRNLDQERYSWETADISWEAIKSIEYVGNEQTIALEVADTHVIGNEIITHNSTLASIICLKEFYDLITLESPQRTWGLLPASPIAILVMAQSQAQVKETIFAAIRGYAENSTYFKGLQEAGYIDILAEEIRCTEKNVAIYAKHTNSKSLVGYTLKCMLLDEVARFETTGEEGKNKAFEIWRNVAAGGAAFGDSFRKVAISSAWEPGDPIEVFYEDAKNDPLTLGFKLTTFQVNLAIKKGITPVIVSDYATDFIKARREYEGIRFSKFNTFIDLENLQRSLKGTTTIDAQPCKIDIETKAGARHYAGLDIIRMVPNNDPEKLQFMHIDPALKKDSAALAMAHAELIDDKWVIVVDTLMKWEPHTDNDGLKRVVSYIDIEQKLDDIHDVRPLYRVTFDQWNSESFIQKLHTKGIDSQQVSCTRDAQFAYYTLFRDLLAHDYIILPKDTLWSNGAVTELSEMVLKPNRQIIHPFAGKDLADAIVNVVYQVHQYMVRAGMNITMGLSPVVVQSATLKHVINTSMVKTPIDIGAARDKLYNIKRYR